MLHRILACGILICLAGSSAQAIDPKYLPADTEIVFTINVRQLLDSDLAKAHKIAEQARAGLQQGVPGGEHALKHLQQAGFDPLTDLHSVTIAMPPSKDPEAAFLVITGKFNSAKLKATAEAVVKENAGALKITQMGSHTVYEVAPPGGKNLYVSLANENTLIVSATQQNLAGALERASKGPVAKKGLLDLLATTNAKQSLSFVATGSALSKLTEDLPVPIPNADQATAILKTMSGISFAVTVEKDLQFQLGVGMGDAEAATKMSQAANGGLLMVKALVQQKATESPEFAPVNDIVKSLKLTSQGSSILLRGEMTSETIMKLPELKKYLPLPF